MREQESTPAAKQKSPGNLQMNSELNYGEAWEITLESRTIPTLAGSTACDG
jgi:hypothetical protein